MMRVVHLDGRRVVVTGGTGFIGRHLAAGLMGRGADVHLLSRSMDRLPGGVSAYRVDYLDPEAVAAAISSIEPAVVFHLAGFTDIGASWAQPADCVRGNAEATANLLVAVEASACRRMVYVSSADVYGPGSVPLRETDEPRPATPYAVASLAAEQLCRVFHQAHGTPVVIARPFNVFGPGQALGRLIPQLVMSGLRGERQEMTSGSQTRDFVFVADAVDALIRLATRDGIEGEVFNLCSGDEVSVASLAGAVENLLGRTIADLGALAHRPNEVWRHFGDPAKLQHATGWTPAWTLADGLAATIESFAAAT